MPCRIQDIFAQFILFLVKNVLSWSLQNFLVMKSERIHIR
ncbi:hypothetical protein CLOBOL_00206 [Enterocloster bolteae ATCC BAA-613]|uniref:Uncharacterized protein n=1 Tax=Enterocloster bolteae (strain ATCC BAA-613 / DSM 15670 / CCUG 46953 / JCM 12243 / WAL 16351) TaxID=411902 RepID=A8RGR8_ENTBW|nr:hypothetical protein CLOBOL_00206 [Enterocloster bolteae ATCC BAA-613]